MSTQAESPEGSLEEPQQDPAEAVPRGAVYGLFGSAQHSGEYNGHIIFSIILAGLAAGGLVSLPVLGWVALCLVTTFLLDERTLKRKVLFWAIPGQFFLYLQVLLHAIRDVLPQYVLAFAIYVCVFPVRQRLDVPVSSLVMLYTFYMVVRLGYLLLYSHALTIGSQRIQLRVFGKEKANLRTRRVALRHVWWAYFLGNVGLIVKCSVQVITIAGFELLRTSLGIDIATHLVPGEHVAVISVAALVLCPLALWLSIGLSLTVYYRAHRTLHTYKPLYDGIHAIHHRGILPTPLDSGTISPLEFIITDMARPAFMLIPNWAFTLVEIGLALGTHLPSHDAGTLQKFAQHHLAHHKHVVFNFGLLPRDDARFGTEFIPENTAAT